MTAEAKQTLIDSYKAKISELNDQIDKCYKNQEGDIIYLKNQISIYEDVITDLEKENA